MRLLAAIFILILSSTNGWTQSKDEERKAAPRDTAVDACLVEMDDWKREICLWRAQHPKAACSTKLTPAEQIKCLEQALDRLTQEIPRLIERHVDSRLKPRMHELR